MLLKSVIFNKHKPGNRIAILIINWQPDVANFYFISVQLWPVLLFLSPRKIVLSAWKTRLYCDYIEIDNTIHKNSNLWEIIRNDNHKVHLSVLIVQGHVSEHVRLENVK